MVYNTQNVVHATCLHIHPPPHALGFVGYVCSTNFYVRFYPSSTHVRAVSQFIITYFLVISRRISLVSGD
jgi:hypothetical protein